jgi:hypothetical protein
LQGEGIDLSPFLNQEKHMAKKEEVKNEEQFEPFVETPVELPKSEPKAERKPAVQSERPKVEYVNCLRKERVIVRHLNKHTGLKINDPKHVFYGGMAENAIKTYTVPMSDTGTFVNILTEDEQRFLEEALGLEYKALSPYKRTDNFWDDSNEYGISRVSLEKQDNYFDLSIPEDYIKYKILLANKNLIAPSLQVLEDTPRATYEYVIISENEETKVAKKSMNATMECYMEFGAIKDDKEVLRTIIEILDGRPTASNVKLDWLQTKANELIQSDSKGFLRVIKDPMLKTKVLIKESIEAGLISKRGDFLYLRKDGTPLCDDNEEPTLNIAAKFLNEPKHQEMKFYLEAQLKQ